MAEWLPVVGTLLGAIVAGGISLLVQHSSQKHARRAQELQVGEDRARWAAERELGRIQRFYGLLDRAEDCSLNYRIAEAWRARGEPDRIPPWVLEPGAAQEALNEVVGEIYFELPLLSAEFVEGVDRISKALSAARMAESDEYLPTLESVRSEILAFKCTVAQRYREVFEARRDGKDRPSAGR